MKTAVIYIICHDGASYDQAINLKHEIETDYVKAHIIKLGASIFFENIAFRYIQERADEWENATFVGIIPYSIKNKTGRNINIQQLINNTEDNIDVISLYNVAYYCHPMQTIVNMSMYDSLLIFHGTNAICAWHSLLAAKGVEYTHIQRSIDNVFYCNSFLARPDAMSEYIKFNTSCQDVVNNNADVRSKMLQEVAYCRPLKPEELAEMKKYGVDYWVCVPFIFERLAPWFFSDMKYKTKRENYTVVEVSYDVYRAYSQLYHEHAR